MFITSTDNKEKVVDYIKKIYTDNDTVNVEVTPDSDWHLNMMNEECRQYKIIRKMRRHYDGAVITCSAEYVRVVLEDEKADKHHVGVVSIA